MLRFNKPPGWNKLPIYLKIRYYAFILDHNYSEYVDKLEAKKIVTSLTNGHIKVAKVVKELKDIEDIQEEDINAKCLLKATHGSGWNLDFKEITGLDEIREFLKKHNKTYSDTNEKQYSYIKPRFFIEEKIDDLYTGLSGKAVVFMFRCIYGKPISIGVKFTDSDNNIINLLYDTKWNIIPQSNNIHKKYRIEKPNKLDIMIKYANVLSNNFEFVRIDYYIDKNNDIYFSEFTFTPSGGDKTFDLAIEYDMGKTWI
jgi:hypothetical protein